MTKRQHDQFWEYVQAVLHENEKYRSTAGLPPVQPKVRGDDAAA